MANAREDLEQMTISELKEIAGVERSDLRPGSGSNGRVVKADWVEAALAAQGRDPRNHEEALVEARAEVEGYRGVSAHPASVKQGYDNRFQVMCSGRYVGMAATAEEGARMYDEALLELDLDSEEVVDRANFPDAFAGQTRSLSEESKA